MSDNLKQTALELANTHNADPAVVVARAAAYLAFLSGSAAPAAGAGQAGAPKTTAGATAPDAAAKAKAVADAKAKADAAAKVKAAADAKAKAAAAGPASGTKAPGGKHTIDEVRVAIRTVATTASLGKQSATDILADDGGGVTKVTDLKPEFFDAVFEACQALLNNEGGDEAAGGAAPEDDLM